MADETIAVAKHEAAHAVVARALGIQVVHAIAGDHPNVRTGYRPSDTEKVVAVDLAGLAVDFSTDDAIEKDMTNARKRAREAVALRHGLAEDAALTPALRNEADELLARQR